MKSAFIQKEQRSTSDLTIETASVVVGWRVFEKNAPLERERAFSEPEHKSHLSGEAKAETEKHADLREAVQVCALVLQESGWVQGSPLPWLECHRAFRVLLRCDRKAERNMLRIDKEGEFEGNLSSLLAIQGEDSESPWQGLGTAKERTAKIQAIRNRIAIMPKNREIESRQRKAESTLESILLLLGIGTEDGKAFGWVDCPAFCDKNGGMKDLKTISKQIERFISSFVAEIPPPTLEPAFDVAERFLMEAISE